MKSSCRSAGRALLVGALAAMSLATASLAADFPTKPITVIVPYPAGSATDNILRPLVGDFEKELGQPVIIENRAGAQGLVAAQSAAHAKPDGYTLFAGSSTSLAANVGLFKSLPYDPIKDFKPVAGLAHTSMMFMVRADSPVKSINDYLSQVRDGKSPASAGYGSSSAQVAIAMLSKASNVKLTAIPYRGTPQAITDLLGGQIPMAVVDVGNGVPQLKSGKLRALALSAPTRSSWAPDVPTLLESFPDTGLVTWIGLVAPAGTPQAVVDRLYAAAAKVMMLPDTRQKFSAESMDIDLASPAELGVRMQKDQARWIDLIHAAGIEPQ